jgi:hypothetical protein
MQAMKQSKGRDVMQKQLMGEVPEEVELWFVKMEFLKVQVLQADLCSKGTASDRLM